MLLFVLGIMVFLIVFCFANVGELRTTSEQAVTYSRASILWFLCGIFLIVLLVLMLLGHTIT